MKVSILKKPREEEWLMVKKAAFRTIGKDTEKLPSIEWKRRMLKAQHSPIRMLEYTFLLEGIPSWVSVHLVRHVHATPFVTTQRNDRMNREEGYDRRKAPQDTPVDMIWYVNAEELITIAHKRLCMLASPETRKVIQDICKAVLRECPEWQETGLLVPLCTYRNGLCDEFKPCDYYMKHGHGYVNSGAALAKALGIGAVVKPRVAITYSNSGYFVNPDGSIDCDEKHKKEGKVTEFGMSTDELKELLERRKSDLPNLKFLSPYHYRLVTDFIEQAEQYLKQYEQENAASGMNLNP